MGLIINFELSITCTNEQRRITEAIREAMSFAWDHPAAQTGVRSGRQAGEPEWSLGARERTAASPLNTINSVYEWLYSPHINTSTRVASGHWSEEFREKAHKAHPSRRDRWPRSCWQARVQAALPMSRRARRWRAWDSWARAGRVWPVRTRIAHAAATLDCATRAPRAPARGTCSASSPETRLQVETAPL